MATTAAFVSGRNAASRRLWTKRWRPKTTAASRPKNESRKSPLRTPSSGIACPGAAGAAEAVPEDALAAWEAGALSVSAREAALLAGASEEEAAALDVESSRLDCATLSGAVTAL